MFYNLGSSANGTNAIELAVEKDASRGFEIFDGIDWRSANEREVDTPGSHWRHKGSSLHYRTVEVKSVKYVPQV